MSKKSEKSFAFFQQAVGLHQAGETAEALRAYDRAIALTPDIGALHDARGVLLAQMKRPEDALKSLNRAAGLIRDNAAVYINRGTVLNTLGRPAEAITDFDRALTLGGESPTALYGLANALFQIGNIGESIAVYDRALELNPVLAVALDGKGVALAHVDRHQDAIPCFQEAARLDPSQADFPFHLGKSFAALRRLEEAMEAYKAAITIDPDRLEILVFAGPTYAEAGRLDQALALFDHALEVDPESLDAQYGRGSVLQVQRRFEEALVHYDYVLERDPDHTLLAFSRDLNKLSINDWTGLVTERPDIIEAVENSKTLASPFAAIALSDDPALHLATARRFMRDAGTHPRPPARVRTPGDRIRIGYYSADFHNHATLHLMMEMLERHDRDRFEIACISFTAAKPDAWTERLIATCDHWHDVRTLSDSAIVDLSRSLSLDIAVDLKGFTQHGRPALFAQRLAPLQLSWLGYPGTMGSAAYDYVLADEVVIPQDSLEWYDEKVVFMPHCYQPNCRERRVSDRFATRASVGLPEGAVVYCCFNQNYKVRAAPFSIWMRILAAVPNSVLWLWVDNATARSNLLATARAEGMDPDRIIFTSGVEVDEHLGRLPNADIFLDTLPYNAHTTASDALRMGLPVVTLPGRSFASRVAASLLTTAGVPELIVDTPEAYEALAIELGRDPAKRTAIRTKLKEVAPASPLFDPEAFARDIERAYVAILERQAQGLPPEHIHL